MQRGHRVGDGDPGTRRGQARANKLRTGRRRRPSPAPSGRDSPVAESLSEANSSRGITTDGVEPSAGITRQVSRSKESAREPSRYRRSGPGVIEQGVESAAAAVQFDRPVAGVPRRSRSGSARAPAFGPSDEVLAEPPWELMRTQVRSVWQDEGHDWPPAPPRWRQPVVSRVLRAARIVHLP